MDLKKIQFNLLLVAALSLSLSVGSGKSSVLAGSNGKCEAKKSLRNKENNKVLTEGDVKAAYRQTHLFQRNPLYRRTKELMVELSSGLKKPFTKIIPAHIVDLQRVGQEPLTFLRQVLVAATLPSLWKSLPADVASRGKMIMDELGGHIGQMSNGTGLTVVKKSVAEFIRKNDGITVDFNDIMLTDGVTGGVEISLKLLQTECNTQDVGVLAPMPIYPLYNFLMVQHGLKQIYYYLNTGNNFELELSELKRAYEDALCSCNCRPRALVLINPGNPSGRILKRKDLEDIVKFAYDNNLIILADEIYQLNLLTDVPFISIHKVIRELPAPYNATEGISFMSISKGFMAEVGLRGGYAHLINIDQAAKKVLDKTMGLKECPNLLGQLALFSVVNPPVQGDPSFELFEKEKNQILSTFKENRNTWMTELNRIPGINCTIVEGGPIVFPRITIPDKAVKVAELKGLEPDEFYAIELLETTGVAVSVGSSFGMPPGHHYLRIIIPATKALGEEVLNALKTFNADFLKKYG